MILKTVGQWAGEAQAAIELGQQQDAAVGGEGVPGKLGHDLAAGEVLKEHGLVLRVCW